MGISQSTPQKATAAPKSADSSLGSAGPATQAPANSEAQDALASAGTPYAQAMDAFKQGIPDPAALLDLLKALSDAERSGIAKNPSYLDQIEARAGGLLLEFHAVLGMPDQEPKEEAPAKDAAAAGAAAETPADETKKKDEHPRLKPDPNAIPGFLQHEVTNAVLTGWKEWRNLVDLTLQGYFATHLGTDVAAAKATGKNELMNLQGPHLPKPPDLGTILGNFGEWMFSAFEGPRHQDIDYSVDVGKEGLITPVLLFFSGMIQYEFWSEALGAGVQLDVSAPSNKTVKLGADMIPLGLDAINVDAVRPRVQPMSKKA